MTIPAEQRKKLEEMGWQHVLRHQADGNGKSSKLAAYIYGAEAAWELATKEFNKELAKKEFENANLRYLLEKCVSHMNESSYHIVRKNLTEEALKAIIPPNESSGV